MRVVRIKTCDDCPHQRYFSGACEHPSAPQPPDNETDSNEAPPEWCPVRVSQGELLVMPEDVGRLLGVKAKLSTA